MALPDDLTVGIDIGTSSVKAVAVDAEGTVVRRSRVPHAFAIPNAQRFEHDAQTNWFDGPQRALRELGSDLEPVGVSVAAMVPSLTAVDEHERPIAPGLLYGDERGAGGQGHPGESGELGRFLEWLAEEYPQARGFRPAQAVANAALSGEATLSTTAAAACYPLFDFVGWNQDLVSAAGARVEQLPRLVPGGHVAATVKGFKNCVLEGGTIDAMAEQMVAGADNDGDVLVLCGTTLIVWIVTSEPETVDGCFSIPHTTPGKFLVGGPSNAGGLFLNWASSLLRQADPDHDSPEGLSYGRAGDPTGDPTGDPIAVPLWVPYPRGERVPLHDVDRRASIHGLDLTHGPAALRQAAFEAAGFVARRMIDATSAQPRRIVATGGGVRVAQWLDTLATCTSLPVDVVAVPEGGALGAAFLARIAAGLETNTAAASRWASISHTVDPNTKWRNAVDDRYHKWSQLAG